MYRLLFSLEPLDISFHNHVFYFMKVSWEKDGKLLWTRPNIAFSQHGDCYSLQAPCVTPDMAGTVTVVARNTHGFAKCEAKVAVILAPQG
jgi:hypothetical protein